MACGIDEFIKRLTKNLESRVEKGSPAATALLKKLSEIGKDDDADKSVEIAEVNKGTSAEKHTAKEVIKAKMANRYIGKGSVNSSTDRYMKVYGDKANMTEYTADDVVWVSSNGKRNGRIDPLGPNGIKTELDNAIEAGATIVMDTEAHIGKTGGYNIGEKALEEYMLTKEYARDSSSGAGVWTRQNTASKVDKANNVKFTTLEEEFEHLDNKNTIKGKVAQKSQAKEADIIVPTETFEQNVNRKIECKE